ncbi:MAG: DUF1351 domain-containing protein [Clostridia bacterium]|nr:DUF1351 domain-containing protein [Clostridia bacterium]
MNEIIQVTQLPVIKQNLLSAKTTVINRINAVKNMAITEDTRAEAKKVRAQLNKEKAEFDNQLKAVKLAVMQPYEDLLITYKECITEPYAEADDIFKTKISEIETGLKKNKADEVERYFNEYAVSLNLDFVKFSDIPLNITLNSSMKSLKNTVKGFLDRMAEEMDSLLSIENKEELFAEYKNNGYNLAQAITTVDSRHKRIEREKERITSVMEQKNQEEETVKKVADIITSEVTPPIVEKVKNEKLATLTFKVTATIPKLKVLKKFLEQGGYTYE